MNFTAHNILLSPGEKTMASPELLSDLELCKSFLRAALAIGGAEPARLRVADLGCLEGGYSAEFARRGYQVLGIEARRANFDKCQYVAGKLGLPNLKFIHDDVKNITAHGTFDIVLCSGILYHLDNPVAYLKTLGRITRKLLILQTHFAPDSTPPPAQPKIDYPLSDLTFHEGKSGRWFTEHKEGASTEERENSPWSAYSNDRSFWLTKKALLQSVLESSFDTVCEQYDYLGDISANTYSEDYSRGLFLGIKTGGA